jgi:rare lipoprotein A
MQSRSIPLRMMPLRAAPSRTAPVAAPASVDDGARAPDFSAGIAALLLIALLFSGCSSQIAREPEPGDSAPQGAIDISRIPDAVPRDEPLSPYGNPPYYDVSGQRYYTLASREGYVERGIASWYGTKFHGRRTSSGDPYDLYQMTAAHKTLPLPTYARVTNLQNGRTIIVKINDRGPFHPNRIIDLSYVAAAKLGILAEGTGLVQVEAISPSAPEKPPVMASASKPAPQKAASLFLQVGAFRNRDNATRLGSKLQNAKLGDIQIMEAANSSGPIYRVRIGPLSSVDEADRLSTDLESRGYTSARVVIN